MHEKDILALIMKIKGAGKSVGEAAQHGYGMAKRGAIANPKTASAIGGAGGMLALQKMLKNRSAEDSNEQQKRLSMQSMYGM